MAEMPGRQEQLGVGIIGAGMILNRQAAAFRTHGHAARLVAVADVDRARAEAARTAYGFQVACADHRELLARDDVQVVSVCTRPDTHAQIVIDAVEAGKHVLCEKPIARTLAEADRVIAACDANPAVKVSCLYQWRSDPAVVLLRNLVAEGALGRALLADVHLRTWRPPTYYEEATKRESWELDGGGVLIVVAIHQLDLLLSLFGDPVEVSAQMESFCAPSDGEDTVVAWVRFSSGALATLRCTACDHRDHFSLQVMGEAAAMQVTGGGSKIFCHWRIHSNDAGRRKALRARGRREAPRRLDPGRLSVRVLRRLYRLAGRTWWPPASWWHAPFVGEYLEALRSGAEVPVPPREARRSLELVTAVYESALFDTLVRPPIDEKSPIYAGVDLSEIRARQEARQ